MEYVNEHTGIGSIGHFAVVLSFVSAIISTIAYYFMHRSETPEWKRLARTSFYIHAAGVLGIVISLYVMIFGHYFEYQYVWQHSSRELPVYYLISCMWEGQEGSFLLWIFFQVILGLLFLKKAGKWEATTMTIYGSVQVFLTSMLLGSYIFGAKIGSSPFVLIRELPEYAGLPFLQNPNYLEAPQFQNGTGLNPLLQNYWMVIHPPTLFLGFASVLPPFVFALSGLWRRQYDEWLKPALSWTFFSVMILGTGILMGGAWAYEALSFGGFWAWDPVENAILVPWLTLVGAAHLMLIQKNKGGNLMSTYVLTFITFILILYSTFLTRSGVLGDSSVHAFVDLGLNGQLLLYLFFYILLSFGALAYHWRWLPKATTDDRLWSREFWMFIGALTLTISSFQITFSTSIPVINKLTEIIANPVLGIFGIQERAALAPPIDVIEHYNSWQLPFALLITSLIAFTQFLKYKKTDFGKFLKSIGFSLAASLILTVVLALAWGFNNALYTAMLFTSIFAVVANFDYWTRILKGKLDFAGASVAHIGFGLVMLGSLVSNAQKEVISENPTYIAKDFPANENILMELGDTIQMGKYYVTWRNERKEGFNRVFEIDYYESDGAGSLEKAFTLEPFIQLNEQMGNVAEPSTRHFLTKDIYTHITYAEPEEVRAEKMATGYGREADIEMAMGDSAIYNRHFVILDSLALDPNRAQFDNGEAINIALVAYLSVINVQGTRRYARPAYVVTGNQVTLEDAVIEDFGLKFRFEDVNPENNKVKLKAFTDVRDEKEFIVMKAIIFPWINILWLGSILMIIGTVMAIRRRIRRS